MQQRIGCYSVTAKIGEGGMGEVYRARDTKLDRDVALKVLPEAFTSDPDRLARFEREAKVLASLNHPNIGAIHGLEDSGDVRALVLELIEGPTLADRISKGPIPVGEALPIAKQIAEALEAAHEQGIIHRDLKPANIKVREDGTVKVLDFGLAKALAASPESDPSESPTLTAAATRAGVILGTAAYMSPEQARGKPVDKRTDIWSFGCVLYEILTGHAAFRGETLSDTIANVLDREPELEALPAGTSIIIETLLRRCWAKDPRRRLRDIGDARLDLDGTESRRTPEVATPPVRPRRSGLLLLPWITAFGVAGLAVLAVATLTRTAPAITGHVIEFPVPLPADGEIWNSVSGSGMAFSPVDQTLVYTVRLGQVIHRSYSCISGRRGPRRVWPCRVRRVEVIRSSLPMACGSDFGRTTADAGRCAWQAAHP